MDQRLAKGKQKQDINNRLFLRPSPNEEAKLLQEQKQHLKKIRLQQVRKQERFLASKAREKFKEKEKKEFECLKTKLKRQWEHDLNEKRSILEKQFYENVAHVGDSHDAALMYDDGRSRERSIEDDIKARERYQNAVIKMREDESERLQKINEKIEAKNKAMKIERDRAAQVAARKPQNTDIAQKLETIQKLRRKQKNIDDFSTTYFHIPQKNLEWAERCPQQVEDARMAAKMEEERLHIAKEESNRNLSEQMEKARLRHKHAISKLIVEKDYDQLLEELKDFERIDRQRRQEIVSKIPKHVFEPAHRRLEANEERQRDIERAFEDMYMAHTNYKGDVTTVQDISPTSPAASDEQNTSENDIKSDLAQTDDVETNDVEESLVTVGEGKKKFVQEAEKSRNDVKLTSKDPLKRLLKKIDMQRDRWKANELDVEAVKDTEEKDKNLLIPDNDSEISEGRLTITTENSCSISAESDLVKDHVTTLMHPQEEAEQARAGYKTNKISDVTKQMEFEKERDRLQQQKLKLQLQQQHLMQEHLRLQFNALNDDVTNNIKSKENIRKSKFMPQELISHDEKGIEESRVENLSMEKDDNSDNTHSSDSSIHTNILLRDIACSIPENVSDGDFVPLKSVSSGFNEVSPSKALVLTSPRISADEDEGRTYFEKTSPLYNIQHGSLPVKITREQSEATPTVSLIPSQIDNPLAQNRIIMDKENNDLNKKQPFIVESSHHVQEMPSKDIARTSNVLADSPISTTPLALGESLIVKFPGNRDVNTASYLHYYQRQLMEQQDRIREQQKAIQERQQQRLEKLKEFQERLRQQKSRFETQKSKQWHSLIPRYSADVELSSTTDHSLPSLELNEPGGMPGLKPTEINSPPSLTKERSGGLSLSFSDIKNEVKPNQNVGYFDSIGNASPNPLGELATESMTRVSEGQSDIVSSFPPSSLSASSFPPSFLSGTEQSDKKSIFPKTSDLGLWSDSTPQLTSSDATKSSSTPTAKSKASIEISQQKMRNSGSNFSNKYESVSEMNSHSSSSQSQYSGSNFDHVKSNGSSGSDSNNNILSRIETSFPHFQMMINEAKSLHENYRRDCSTNDTADDDNMLKESEQISFSVNNGNSSKTGMSETFQHKSFVDIENLHYDSKADEERREVSQGEASVALLANQEMKLNESPSEEPQFPLSKDIQNEHDDSEMSRKSLSVIHEETFVSDVNLSHRSLEKEDFNEERLNSRVTTYSVEPEDDSRQCSVEPGGDNDEYILEPGNDSHEYSVEPGDDNRQQLNNSQTTDDCKITTELDSGSFQNENESYVTSQMHFDTMAEDRRLISDKISEIRHSLKSGLMENMASTKETSLLTVDFEDPQQLLQRSSENFDDQEESLLLCHGLEGKNELNKNTANKDRLVVNIPTGKTMTSSEASRRVHVDLPSNDHRDRNDYEFSKSVIDEAVLPEISSLFLFHSDDSSNSSLSLQNAFRKSRPKFIENSCRRALKAKEARYTKHQTSEIETKDKLSQFPASSDSLSKENIPEKYSTKKQSDMHKKIKTDEMKRRTKRLYENLPDIQQKAVEKRRQETYASNRAKAQEFQKQTRERLRKLSARKTGKET